MQGHLLDPLGHGPIIPCLLVYCTHSDPTGIKISHIRPPFFWIFACFIQCSGDPGRELLQIHKTPKYQPVPGEEVHTLWTLVASIPS